MADGEASGLRGKKQSGVGVGNRAKLESRLKFREGEGVSEFEPLLWTLEFR